MRFLYTTLLMVQCVCSSPSLGSTMRSFLRLLRKCNSCKPYITDLCHSDAESKSSTHRMRSGPQPLLAAQGLYSIMGDFDSVDRQPFETQNVVSVAVPHQLSVRTKGTPPNRILTLAHLWTSGRKRSHQRYTMNCVGRCALSACRWDATTGRSK